MIKLFKLYEEIEEARAYFLEILEPHVFVASDGTRLPYRLYVPPYRTPGQKLPLQMHMHGGGIRGDDNRFQLYHDATQTQMLLAYQHKEPFIFAIPQCPTDAFWSQFQAENFPWGPDDPFVPMADVRENRITRAMYELTMYLAETYEADRERLYLSGASLGGCGVYELIYRHPGVFAGGIVGCTNSDPATAPQLADVPLYILHGDADPTISVEHSRRMVQALEEVGAEYVYREFPGRLHDFTACPTGEADLGDAMRWMFAHRRSGI